MNHNDWHDSFMGQFGSEPTGEGRRLSKSVHARLDQLAARIKWAKLQLGGYYSNKPAEFTGTPEQRANIERGMKRDQVETDLLYSGVPLLDARTQAEAETR